ncbi:MAG: type II CAAX prenyl endopeptidase Rce1 family protein [Patescibacteria group bacterium]
MIILPLALITSGMIRARWRWYLLTGVVLAISGVFFIRRTTLADIGIHTDYIVATLLAYGIFAVTGCVFLRWLSMVLGQAPHTDWRQDTHFRYWFIPISIGQQYVFMSFSLRQLIELTDVVWAAVIINAVLFAIMHSIYGNWRVHLPLALVAGLGFSALYSVFPNLIVASAAHMVLNFTAVYYGFFVNKRSVIASNEH